MLPMSGNVLSRQPRRRLDLRQDVAGRRPLGSEFQHSRDQRIDIAYIGAMIDDRRTYRELAVQNRRRWRRDSGFLNIGDNIAVDPVGIISAITEAYDIEL